VRRRSELLCQLPFEFLEHHDTLCGELGCKCACFDGDGGRHERDLVCVVTYVSSEEEGFGAPQEQVHVLGGVLRA
jgi:hypothetical protein